MHSVPLQPVDLKPTLNGPDLGNELGDPYGQGQTLASGAWCSVWSSQASPWVSEETPPYLLALPLGELAVEAVKEAAGRVALAVAVAVTEILPALQGLRAVLPRVVEVEGAVAAIPATRVVVTLQVADLIACVFLALGQLAGLLDLRWGDVAPSATCEAVVQDVAQQPVEFGRA